MYINFLLDIFKQKKNDDALVHCNKVYSYAWLLDRINHYRSLLSNSGIREGQVVVLEGDFSPDSVALFLTLIDNNCIIVPVTNTIVSQKNELCKIAQADCVLRVAPDGKLEFTKTVFVSHHDLYQTLRHDQHPGLVLFSSGTTGQVKAAVHDFSRLLRKFKQRRHDLRTLTFLLFDHIGGIDTLFYSLSNGSCVITIEDRSPAAVCRAVQQHQVQVLPVTPTFLNLLLLSETYKEFDLSSLKYITYGTEVMPSATLKAVSRLFPDVVLLQKFGTTEVGTLRSKSESSDSVWVKIGGEGFETRIVEGILHIKAESAMLGYLNAPSPFSEDGWFITGDAVEQKGSYIRFLGRKSEIINVGGVKVYPAEIENIIQQVDNVSEVSVYGEGNAIIGNIVCARVTLSRKEESKHVIARIKNHCLKHLERFKVPMKIQVTSEKLHSERFKKVRQIP